MYYNGDEYSQVHCVVNADTNERLSQFYVRYHDAETKAKKLTYQKVKVISFRLYLDQAAVSAVIKRKE